MDPTFIYYNDLKFAENKQFTLEFKDDDLLLEIILKKIETTF